MSNQEEFKKCNIDTYCCHLENNIGDNPYAKGISIMQLTDIRTMKPSRRYVRYRKTAKDRGMVFNFCPWCGGRLREESL